MLGIYCRISRENDGSKSIENQKKDGINFANKNGWEYETFIDSGISGGAKIEDRPAFASLINAIEDKKIKAVYIWNSDRAARQESTWFFLADLIVKHKVNLYENGELIDLEDPSITLVQGMKALVNANFRRVTSKKIKDRLLKNVEEGKAHAKVMPLGYAKDENGYLVINEKERPTVEKIYQMCLDGKGSTTIKHWLNDNNIPTRYNGLDGTLTVKNKQTGKETTKNKKDIIWSDKTVQDILRNTIYKGKRKWNNKYYDCPAIFDEIFWERVQVQYQKNSQSTERGKNTDHLYLLKGLLECSECGRNFYGRARQNKKDNYYMCSSKRYKNERCQNRSINIDVLDSFIWQTTFNNLYNNLKREFDTGGVNKRREELNANIARYVKEIEANKRKLDKGDQLVLEGVMAPERYKAQQEKIEKEIKELEIQKKNDQEEYLPLRDDYNLLQHVRSAFEVATDKESKKRNINKEALTVGLERAIRSAQLNSVDFNTKQSLLRRYLKRIYISWNPEHTICTIAIAYQLPMMESIYFMDGNYLFAWDNVWGQWAAWDSPQTRYFTDTLKKETMETLKNYSLRTLSN